MSFLAGYRKAAGAAVFVPSDPEEFAVPMDTYLLEKAVYELGYELNNRPAWLTIPLDAIERMLA